MRVGFNNRWTRNQEKRAHYLAILRIRPRASHEQSGHTLALQPFRRSRSIVQRGKARRALNLHGGAQLEPPPHRDRRLGFSGRDAAAVEREEQNAADRRLHHAIELRREERRCFQCVELAVV